MSRPMNAIVKALWIAALRSNSYRQGYNVLRDSTDNYCCLGVLCDIHVQHHKATSSWQQSCPGKYDYFSTSTSLPIVVKHWAGLGNIEPFMLWNDDDRLTFAEIADKIEADY